MGWGRAHGEESSIRPSGASQGHPGSSRGLFRGRAGSGPCSAKAAEPIRRRYLQRHPLATASMSLSPQARTRDQLSLWGQERFCKLFRHGFHTGPLPSQHLWWEKHSRRTTGILQIDTDKNSPAGPLYPVGPGPAWYDQARPGAPLREGGTEGGEPESSKGSNQNGANKISDQEIPDRRSDTFVCCRDCQATRQLFSMLYINQGWYSGLQERVFFFCCCCFFKKLPQTFLLSFKGKL